MLKMADMMADIKLLELAKKAAAEILSDDPKLDKPENAALSKNIQRLLEEAAV
jgi:RecG-like helicase